MSPAPPQTDRIDADLAPLALLVLTDRRAIAAANAEAEEMFARSRRTLCSLALSEIVFHDSPLFELLDKAESLDGQLSAPAVPVSGPTLPQLLLDVRVGVRTDGGFVLALAPALVREHSAPPQISTFARILGHEVKNPLAGISGAAQLLLRHAQDVDAELLELIRRESQRIERLVNRLSMFELFSAPRFAEVNIHEVLDHVLQLERAASHNLLRIERRFDPSLPPVRADADHLHEAFQNLIRNAVEAVSETPANDARICVSTAYEAGLTVSTPGGEGASSRALRVSIEDNGPGIDPDFQVRIFDMFESSKSRGGGMGLAVVKEIVAAHGGHLNVDGRSGGTRIDVVLPLALERRS